MRKKSCWAVATTHAWEDFAETWAHYLHIVDTLETAAAFGLEMHPAQGGGMGGTMDTTIAFDPYAPGDFTRLIDAWLPLTTAMNSMNRSMGLADLYPFVLSPPVIAKLAFLHRLVHRRTAAARDMDGIPSGKDRPAVAAQQA